MKWTMMATEAAIQFNLEPESDHERKLMDALREYTGEVRIHKGVQVAECMGGYLRNFGEIPRVLAVTICRPTPPDPGHERG